MDIIEPILAIAEKLYSLCEEVKANKKRCRRLAHRVLTLAELVRAVKVHGFGTEPEQVRNGLKNLKLTLESAEKVVKKYTSFSYLRRVAKAYDLGEEFSFLNERLNDAAQVLSLALQVEHRASIEKVFQEATRWREDEEDRQSDSLELRELLQSLAQESKGTNMMVDAVQKTANQTQRDVLDIKEILESLKKPHLHLQDIREIKPEELTYSVPTQPLMKNSHSELYKGTYNKFTVAIKRYSCPLCTCPSDLRSVFNKEVETMKRFESPNILRMFGICVEDENGSNPSFLIVMEYCEKGSLRQVLDSNCNLPWERKMQMCLDAAQGLYRLHQSEEKFKVHGSIRSSSFLVAAGYRVKLGGFELAKTETSLQKNKSRRSSAFHYNSPQQLQNVNHPYDKACEIYSFGIVLWETATRDVPFKDCTTPSQIFQKVYVEKVMEPLPTDCPKKLKELINACRSFEPFLRPTAGVLVDMLLKMVEED
ncbi:mixed lineage kinase domain-like protein isoform X1 [Sinocyclocheilus grahami]|uniref:mixed lineage kinase domain-like protein isoform X1 n=1 Tax=Sinocyclocheilus grahami TaxID=75366 RepID=UPI0007ACACF0|nr:PREDICTED: mixed lineage kinase domain-like protein isoform X1 [Sinocyclocheilus grahami]XP_016103043.1 PREDICTED: mixed lineage kinase domain-like protein isoform X1 [Sinocyclocheilus grahami]